MGETGDLHNVVELNSGGVPTGENSVAVSRWKTIGTTQIPIDR